MSSLPNSNSPAKRLAQVVGWLVMVVLVLTVWMRDNKSSSPPVAQVDTPVENPIAKALRPPEGVGRREGIGVAVLIDTSGSMEEAVADVGSERKPKIDIAKKCLASLAEQLEAFAKQHPDKRIEAAFYEFSSVGSSSCRQIVPLSSPNAAAVKIAAERLHPTGSTPIGDAMIQAKQDLDRSGLTKLHILVITDGENNRGYALPDVAAALANQEQEHRANTYFVAFDVSEKKFSAIRDAGGLVLSASSGQELRQTLDYVLSGKILAEAPVTGPQ